MVDPWREWQDIENAKKKESDCYGVYQIRIIDNNRRPIPIPRIGGVDKEGIIYIGKAEPKHPLGHRIDDFLAGRHSGSGTYDLMWEI